MERIYHLNVEKFAEKEQRKSSTCKKWVLQPTISLVLTNQTLSDAMGGGRPAPRTLSHTAVWHPTEAGDYSLKWRPVAGTAKHQKCTRRKWSGYHGWRHQRCPENAVVRFNCLETWTSHSLIAAYTRCARRYLCHYQVKESGLMVDHNSFSGSLEEAKQLWIWEWSLSGVVTFKATDVSRNTAGLPSIKSAGLRQFL